MLMDVGPAPASCPREAETWRQRSMPRELQHAQELM